MPALCDVNVLLALVTDRHALHDLAVRWAESVPAGGGINGRVQWILVLTARGRYRAAHAQARPPRHAR